MTVIRNRLGRIEIITLARPEKSNALDGASIDGLGIALAECEQDTDVHAVVITGAGDRAFCAGMDLRGVKGAEPRPRRDAPLSGYMRFIENGLDKPVVAAVNGAAVAGGFELMLACDLVVAAEHAQFGIPEVRRGLIAGAGGTLLPLRIPKVIALELGIVGELICAQRAYEVGLVNRIVPKGRALEAAVELAEAISKNSPAAVQTTRQLMANASHRHEEDLWRDIHFAVETAMNSADAAEGAAAFLEKREPVWRSPDRLHDSTRA